MLYIFKVILWYSQIVKYNFKMKVRIYGIDYEVDDDYYWDNFEKPEFFQEVLTKKHYQTNKTRPSDTIPLDTNSKEDDMTVIINEFN